MILIGFPLLLFFLIKIAPPTEEPRNPCNPSPCGANAVCNERNGAGSCSCLQEYYGDPYGGCHPECVLNSDCDRSKACTNNKCKDPCPGVCGVNAECRVQNHAPNCYCLPEHTGDPANICRIIEAGKVFFFFVCLYIVSMFIFFHWCYSYCSTNYKSMYTITMWSK